MIFHITTLREWEQAKASGVYSAPSLTSEGFVHCSTQQQIVDTGNLLFKGRSGLVLLCIDEEQLDAELRFESPKSSRHASDVDKLFPHVYGKINLSSVVVVVDFPCGDDGLFVLPIK